MARVAQRAGYPEVAEVLKVIAWEEAEHAAQYAELAAKAKAANLEELYTFIDHAARDEARHACMLKGLLDRL